MRQNRLNKLVERHPVWVIVLLFALLAFPLTGLTTRLVERYFSERFDEYFSRIGQKIQKENEAITIEFNTTLHYLKHFAQGLSEVSILQRSLHHPTPENILELNDFLQRYAQQTNLNIIHILDAQGTCIAASNHDLPTSPIGQNFSDRNYFQQAILQGSSVQFVVGRITNIPELYSSARIMDVNQRLGVITLKVDMAKLPIQPRNAASYLFDPNGVIIQAADPRFLYHTQTGSIAETLDTGVRRSIYGRARLPLLPLHAGQEHAYRGRALASFAELEAPVLSLRSALSEDGFSLLTLYELAALPGMQQQYQTGLWLTPLIALIVLLSLLSSLIYVWRNRISEQTLETAYRRLAEMNTELQQQATHDHLTQVANRRLFQASLNIELIRRHRHQRPLSLALLDLDYFKRINDTFGHQAGDAALVHFANLVSSLIRKGDLLARIGGEEFALILPDTYPEHAIPLLTRVCEHLAGTPLQYHEHSIQLTVSIGITEARHIESLQDLLSRADHATYSAKIQGRNRVIYEPSISSPTPVQSS